MTKIAEAHRHTVKISEAISAVILCIRAKKVPIIHGSPAIGKSAIVHYIAEQFNLKLLDERLATAEPTDLKGFPNFNHETNRASFYPMDSFPIEGDDLPMKINADGSVTKYDGWLLFLDELTSAPASIQAAAYKIILDRMVGNHRLHDKVAIVAAGNLETDGAIVEEMSTALQSRMIHIDLTVDQDEWIDWATKNAIDYRIISFINYKPKLLYTFKPDHTDRTYSAPRTLAFVNDLLKVGDLKDAGMLTCIIGSISEPVAREFYMFCEIFSELTPIKDIIAAPDQIKVPEEPSILFAMAGSVAHHANVKNIGQLLIYVSRLPIEFQIVCMKMVIGRDNTIMSNGDVQKWITTNAKELF